MFTFTLLILTISIGMRPEDDDDGRERRSSPRRQHSTWPANDQRSPFNQGARCGPGAFPTTSNAQFAPGQVQGMSFEFQKTLDTLMHQVQEEITPQPAEEEDSDENCSVDGEQDPRMTAPVSIDTEMSNLSLDENRPAYSRVKSDPQNSYPSSAQAASPLNLDQFRPESVPALPEHMQQPFVMPPNPASPTSGPYAQYAPAPIPLWSSHGRQPTTPAFPERQSSFPPPHPGTASGPYAAPYAARQGMAQGGANGAYGGPPMAPPPPRSSGPVYNTIHGDYNKVDQSVHSTNIGSGNTHNMLIQDSYNDNSVKTYAQPGKSYICRRLKTFGDRLSLAPRPKRQGRMPSGYR